MDKFDITISFKWLATKRKIAANRNDRIGIIFSFSENNFNELI